MGQIYLCCVTTFIISVLHRNSAEMPPFPNSSNLRPFLVPSFGGEEEVEGGVNTIYLSRHGESQNNLFGRIGGNAELSERGEKYAQALSTFIASLHLPDLKVSFYNRYCDFISQKNNLAGYDNVESNNSTS